MVRISVRLEWLHVDQRPLTRYLSLYSWVGMTDQADCSRLRSKRSKGPPIRFTLTHRVDSFELLY